jgi:hypothetical protein
MLENQIKLVEHEIAAIQTKIIKGEHTVKARS